MLYQPITADHVHLARHAKAVAEKLGQSIHKSVLMLQAEFCSEEGKPLGVSMTPAANGQQASILSPFGEARSHFSIYLNGSGIFGRYMFERKERYVLDREIWRPVFHFDISSTDQIIYEMTDINRFALNTPYRHQYFDLALAITAGLGRELEPLALI
jgi:hypothetical protein